MNIKELVLVISILLSIRIAEYAMKKYKEQKDVEVTKKQKSRKQTKKIYNYSTQHLESRITMRNIFLVVQLLLLF